MSIANGKEQKGKPNLALLFRSFLVLTTRAREHGLTKYGYDDFRKTTKIDIISACLRHIFADLDGEQIDPDSGLPHLAMAAGNLMLEIEKKYDKTHQVYPVAKSAKI